MLEINQKVSIEYQGVLITGIVTSTKTIETLSDFPNYQRVEVKCNENEKKIKVLESASDQFILL